MTLSTLDQHDQVHARVVLLKGISKDLFFFYTNYNSHKGEQLAFHSQAALLFYWDPLGKQIRISGDVRKTSRQESVSYWQTRSRKSQISQWISQQSQPISHRNELEQQYLEAQARFENQDIPCPEHWGGYALNPTHIEFWMAHPDRLHDRFLFTRNPSTKVWDVCRLSP